MYNENQFKIWIDMWITPNFRRKILQNIIKDRWSKYTVLWWFVKDKTEVKKFMKEIIKDKYFRRATHNTYAYRLKQDNGSVLEWKNDDWETWAWMCILRELNREEIENCIVVVTRYFWWVKLQADRFKHVIDATKIFINEIK